VPELELWLRRELRLEGETQLRMMELKDTPSEEMRLEEEREEGMEQVVQWGEEESHKREV
jgi:hypothetical protein